VTGIEIVTGRQQMDRIVELGSIAFEVDAGAYREFLQWKHEQNPYSREPLFYVALDANERAVGMRTFYATRWSTGEGEVEIPAADDFAIAAEHRHTGLATSLMRSALDDLDQRGFEYVLSTSAGEVTALQSLAMGWRSVGAMEPAERNPLRRRAPLAVRRRVPHRIRPLLRSFRRRGNPGRARSGFEALDAAGGRRSVERGATVVVTSSPNAEALADLESRLPRDGRIRHVRDSAFFRWRYANPAREYRFLLYEVEAQLEGYLAIARCRYLGSATPLLIVNWAGTTPEARAELLECALARCGTSDIRVWTASLPPESKVLLARSGFRPAQPDLRARGLPCVLLRKLGESGEWLLGGAPAVDPTRWVLSLIDSMIG
jgi:GNAT superfamily N-acetyltransferase